MTEQEMIEAAINGGTSLRGQNGAADNQHVYYEADGQPYYKLVGGGKQYIPPAAAMSMFNDPQALAWAQQQGYNIKGGAQGLAAASKGTVGADGKTTYPDSPVSMANQGGGLWHTTGVWNSKKGSFDSDFDWGNLTTMLVAAGLTMGAASAIAGGVAAGNVAAQTAAANALAGTSTAAGTVGPMAGGLLGATTAAEVPGALAGIGATTAATGATAGLVGPLAGGLTGAATDAGALVPAALSSTAPLASASLGTSLAAATPAVSSSLGPAAAAGTGVTATGTMAGINNAVGSPLGQLAIGAIGNYLSAKGQAEQAGAGRQQLGAQFAANQLNTQQQQDRTNAQAAATPLGENQNFAAHNALMNAILPNMRNFSYAKGGQPTAQGGILPPGGLDPAMVDSLYGSTPTLESLAQRQKQISAINPQAPQDNLANYGGFGAKAAPFTAGVSSYQSDQQKKQDAQRTALQDYINQNLSGNEGPLRSAIIGTGSYK